MKSIETICIRAVILLCLSDRCALEKSYINGRVYSLKAREVQRQAIYNWLLKKGYSKYITYDEKRIFEQEIGKGNSDDIISMQIQYESIEPCLWVLGIKKALTNYDDFVLEDFHPILEIGSNHSLEVLIERCKFKDENEIIDKREVAMLWNWRAIEGKNPIFKERNAREIIISTFGDEYKKIADMIEYGSRDFKVGNKQFYELNGNELEKVKSIAYWRQYAFEWITGENYWDKVEIDT